MAVQAKTIISLFLWWLFQKQIVCRDQIQLAPNYHLLFVFDLHLYAYGLQVYVYLYAHAHAYVDGTEILSRPFSTLLYSELDTYASRCRSDRNHNSSYQVLIQPPNSAFAFPNRTF